METKSRAFQRVHLISMQMVAEREAEVEIQINSEGQDFTMIDSRINQANSFIVNESL
jgi:hypothetical protein